MTTREPGYPARFHGWCARCDRAILFGQRVVQQAGGWVHVECHAKDHE